MWFNTWGWHVKNAETSVSFNYWMVWLHYWRMPLLLFISGAGTYMALGKRTPKQFAVERFRRLFIPLIFGMFVVVPPQIYFEHISEYDNYWGFYKTVFQFKPYPQGSFSWHHLWFILYLLLYSLIALPFLNYLRSQQSLNFRTRVFKILSNPWSLFLTPVTIIFLTQLVLRPFFPEERHDLIRDWAFFVYYFCFFLFGMLCYSNQELWQRIGDKRKFLLITTLIALTPFYICYFHFRGLIVLPFEERTVEIIFDILAMFVSWITVITVIAFGQHYLNKPHAWLKYFNEGLYPFYILHQTVIIAAGYYICQLDWSIAAKFWSIILLTLIGCLGFYVIIIRPFRLTRILFGMKPGG